MEEPRANELHFGDSWAVFRGVAAHNTPHAHAAVQVVIGATRPVTIVPVEGTPLAGPAFAIRPLVTHSLTAAEPVTLLYVEAQSTLARHLYALIGEAGIAAIEPSSLAFSQTLSVQEWSSRLSALAPPRTASIDPRLLSALERLTEDPGRLSIQAAALACGLSDSRLRSLARTQLGLPVATWLIWRKLDRAVRTLQEGAELAEAAAAGGFADQAHFARAMRRMFGVTPRATRQATIRPDNRSVQD